MDAWVKVEDADIRGALLRLQAFGADTTPAMRDIAAIGEATTRMRFRTGIDPDGRPWKVSNRVAESGGRTLTLDGHLGDSVSSRYGRRDATWGVNRVYAALQQFGGTVVPRKSRYLSVPLTNKARVAGSPRNYEGKLVFLETEHGKFLYDPDSETAQYVLLRKVTVPARPFLGLSRDDREDILDAIERRIDGLLGAIQRRVDGGGNAH